jgi:phage tail sheath gpL-like
MTIPTNLRVPVVSVDIDPSNASQGPSVLPLKVVMIGQKLAAGTVAAGVLTRISSADQAGKYFGKGSHLHLIAKGFFAANQINEVWAIGQADAGSAVVATGTLTLTGNATAAGVLVVLVAGVRYEIAVASGDTPTIIAGKVVTALTADVNSPVTAGNSAGVVTFTAKNAGTLGNNIDIRVNYQAGDILPAGVTAAVVAMASGATDPTIQTALDLLGDEWYHIFVTPYSGVTNVTALENFLADRFGPLKMLDGVAITAQVGNLSTLQTYGLSRNCPHVVTLGLYKYPNTPMEIIGATAGRIASEAQADPAIPQKDLTLPGILSPVVGDRFLISEANSLLYSGIATLYSDSGSSTVKLQRMITTYQLNSSGAADVAYLKLETMLTIMYTRYDVRTQVRTKFGRAKLADDGTNFGVGQQVVTPNLMRAFLMGVYKNWEKMGLVENADVFKSNLQVTRDAADKDRLNITLPPDFINQAFVVGITVQFRL